MPFWRVLPSNDDRTSTELTFVDLIKGIVPQSLYDIVIQYTESSTTTRNILHLLMNDIHHSALELIWKPRCAFVITTKHHAGITSRHKKSRPSGSLLDDYHRNSTSFRNCNAIPAQWWEDHVFNLINYSINFYLLASLVVGLFTVLTQFVCFFLGSPKRVYEKGCILWWII